MIRVFLMIGLTAMARGTALLVVMPVSVMIISITGPLNDARLGMMDVSCNQGNIATQTRWTSTAAG